jgi:hypothetical protein
MADEVFIFPPSFAQQRQWFLDQLDPGNPAYNLPYHLWLAGPLDVTALESSLSEIVRRHETLRTIFIAEEGRPAQVITPTIVAGGSLSLPVVDLSRLPEAEREAELWRLAAEVAQHRFDLARGPLLRVALLRWDEEEHMLLLTMHHIVSDLWSIGVCMRELAVLYEAFSSGKPSPLPELPIQYADFACWQRQWLRGETLDNLLSYWKRQLDGAPAFLALPTDHPRPPIQSFRGAAQHFRLSRPLTEALKALSRREGVTLFMTLLAAFQTLLYRYSGQDDILVGTFIANRNQAETEGLIGFFVNNLVLRTDLSGNPSFRELLAARVRKVCLEAYAHQDLPFEKLLEELQPQRDLSRTPLFQVMFVLQNAPTSDLKLPGLQVIHWAAQKERSEFDLTLWMSEWGEVIAGSLEYSTDLFEAATISRMLKHFQMLLEGLVAHPDRRLLEFEGIEVHYPAVPEAAGPAQADDLSFRQAQLSARRAKLSAAKWALLEKRLRGEGRGSSPDESIETAHGAEPGFSPLVGIQPAGERRPFFCVHPVGGDVLCYLDLARHLGADQPFYGLQYPDLNEESGADTRVEGLAARYIEALRAVQPPGPYLLGGWSMGGLVAFEMAQQLRQQGQQVALVALIDTWAEAHGQEFTTEDWTALLNSFAQRSGLPPDHLAFLFDRLWQGASEEESTT